MVGRLRWRVVAANCPTGSAGTARTLTCANPGVQINLVPWHQQMFARSGSGPSPRNGVIVAVLDTGVDAQQPQLRGVVDRDLDAITGHGRRRTRTVWALVRRSLA